MRALGILPRLSPLDERDNDVCTLCQYRVDSSSWTRPLLLQAKVLSSAQLVGASRVMTPLQTPAVNRLCFI